MRHLILTLLYFTSIAALAQSTYQVSWEQSVYEKLENPGSIALDFTGSPVIVEATIDLGFDFPFFDTTYQTVSAQADGILFFETDVQEGFFNFHSFATLYNPFIPYNVYPYSNWTYKRDTIDGLRVFKIEHKDFLPSDYFYDIINTPGVIPTELVNFQTWIYEDGALEIYFGDISLSNPTYYRPDLGFIDEGGEIMGPFVFIYSNYTNETLGVGGDYDNPQIFTSIDSLNVYLKIPPKGWKVRFERKTNGTAVEPSPKPAPDIKIFPTLSKDGFFNCQNQSPSDGKIQVYDQQGKLYAAQQLKAGERVRMSLPQNSLYFVHFSNNTSSFTTKIILQK